MTKQQIIGLLSTLTAIAEGYDLTTEIPWRQRNPGDLIQWPGATPTPDGKVKFDLHSQGWLALEAQWEHMLSGNSPLYPRGITWAALSARYCGQAYPNPWCREFTSTLAVDAQTPVQAWVDANLDPPTTP